MLDIDAKAPITYTLMLEVLLLRSQSFVDPRKPLGCRLAHNMFRSFSYESRLWPIVQVKPLTCNARALNVVPPK
jgi:hypothetical protein